ncbi:MAG TPA: glycoside hydrolase family 16 protein [Tichowtungia sp.]|nr:glycoside hydrolase family 16 protein [Tichowtungia sp.]
MMQIKTALAGMAIVFLAVGPAHSAVVWSDEFNEATIDKETWGYDYGGGGFGNGQLEFNTARSENVYVENGSLILEARDETFTGGGATREFTSARVNTQGRFAFTYGTLEARIQLPDTADGLWPAFWLLGNNFPGIAWPDCGEIDILESGADAGIQNGTQNELINSAIHFSNAADEYEYYAEWINASDYIGTDDLSADYHLYKVEWTPTDLTFYIDDVQFATWDITAPHFEEYHHPHFPILNVAIGGWNYVKINEPGGITASFPAQMKIDWIRLSDNGYTEVYLGADAAETGNFGVFTETTPVDTALVYGDDTSTDWPYSDEAAVYPWADTMTFADDQTEASEGSEGWTFDVAGIGWCGMGVFLPNFRNMENYSDGFLHVDIKTTSTDLYEFGIESARGQQAWLPVGDETAEFGFARDGNWHTVSIPLGRFGNTDFKTVHQIFMLLCTASTGGTTLSLDNIWWEPSVPRPVPAGGSFGVYTETEANKTAGEFALGADGEFFIWADTLIPGTQDPSEGTESLSLQSAPALSWFGAAFTADVKYDLSAFDNPNGKLHFSMKTSSSVPFQIGMKSGNQDGVGQKWIDFVAGSDPYGFLRDGAWHSIEIPVSNLVADVDFSQMSQLFQILGTAGPISDIEMDDIYYSGGLANETNVVSAIIEDGVGISWPSTDGSTYTVQWTDRLTNANWNSLSPTVEGDWTTKTMFDPFGMDPSRFYQVIETP